MSDKPKEQEKPNEVALWRPTPFQGVDLLPVHAKPGVVALREAAAMEEVEIEDIVLPSLSLLQGQSDAVTQGVPGATPGKWFHSVTQEVFTPPLRVLLVYYYKTAALFPNPQNPAHSGLEKCLSRDLVQGTKYGLCESCPHNFRTWDNERNEPPACAATHNFVAMLDNGPAVIRMAKSAYKVGRNFLSNVKLSGGSWWDHPIILASKQAPKEVGGKMTTYHVPTILWQRSEATPEAYRAAAQRLYEQVKAARDVGKLREDEGSIQDAV